MSELNVALRVQAQLDHARKAIQDLKAEILSLDAATGDGKGASFDATGAQAATDALQQQTEAANSAASAQARLVEQTDQAATAAQQQAAATTQTASDAQAATTALQHQADATAAATSAQADLAASAGEAAAAGQNQAAVTDQAAAASDRSTQATKQLTQATDGVVVATEKERRALDALMGELVPGVEATNKLKNAQAELNAALSKGWITQEQHTRMMALAQQRWAGAGKTAKETAAAMRMLPAQITDITTSIVSGMPIWLVLLQQGGQVKDSFGGIGPAARAMVGAVKGATLAYAGLAAGVGTVIYAYVQAQREEAALRESIVMTGNAAGVSVGQLYDMANATSAVIGTTGKAVETLGLLTTTGQVARENMQRFAQTAIEMEIAVGKSVEATVKEFEELGKSPVEASKKLNERYNYLTAAVYAQIQALQDQGRTTEAANLAQETYSQEMSRRAAQMVEELGWVEIAWRSVGDAVSWTWDRIKDIGRTDTAAENVAFAFKELDRLNAKEFKTPWDENRIDRLVKYLNVQQEILTNEDRAAKREAERVETQRKGIAAREYLAKLNEKSLAKEEQVTKAIARLHERIEDAKTSDPTFKISDAEVKKFEEQLRKEIMSGSGGTNAASNRIKANLRVLQDSFKEGDALLVRALEKGNISISDAYEQRVDVLEKGVAAQRAALEGELKTADANRKVQIQAELQLLDSSLRQSKQELDDWRLEQQRQLDSLTVRLRLDVSALTGSFDKDAIAAQLQERYRADYEAAGRLGNETAQQFAREQIDMLVKAGAAQAEFNAKLEETSRLQSQLGVIEEALNIQAEKGLISQIEAEARLSQARAAQIPILQHIAEDLQQIRDALPPEAVAAADAMTASIGQLENQVTRATPTVVALGTQLKNTVIDGVADAAGTAVTNFENLRDAAASTLKQIAGDIVRSNIKRLLTDQFTPDGAGGGSGLFGAIIGGVKSIFGFAAGGSPGDATGNIRRYAEGGLIQGPGTGTSDSIPAIVDGRKPIAVSTDEYIQPQRAVRHYGMAFMEAVRTLKFPKPNVGYALGGLVQAHRQARFATGGQVSGSAAGAGQAAPNVILQVTNTGTPQRVERQDARWEGRDMIVSVIMADIRDGGPISRSLGTRGRG